jgi:hypothetical protein
MPVDVFFPGVMVARVEKSEVATSGMPKRKSTIKVVDRVIRFGLAVGRLSPGMYAVFSFHEPWMKVQRKTKYLSAGVKLLAIGLRRLNERTCDPGFFPRYRVL